MGNRNRKHCSYGSPLVLFYEFIQSELNEVRAYWNSHYIRKFTFGTVAGRPEEFFFFPESFGYEHRDIQITVEDIAKVLAGDNFLLRAKEVIKASDEELCYYFRYIISQEGLNRPPRDWKSAGELYKTLVNTALF